MPRRSRSPPACSPLSRSPGSCSRSWPRRRPGSSWPSRSRCSWRRPASGSRPARSPSVDFGIGYGAIAGIRRSDALSSSSLSWRSARPPDGATRRRPRQARCSPPSSSSPSSVPWWNVVSPDIWSPFAPGLTRPWLSLAAALVAIRLDRPLDRTLGRRTPRRRRAGRAAARAGSDRRCSTRSASGSTTWAGTPRSSAASPSALAGLGARRAERRARPHPDPGAPPLDRI